MKAVQTMNAKEKSPEIFSRKRFILKSVAGVGLFVLRTSLEDKALQDELPGYKEYAQKVRFRLVPGVW